MPLEFFDLNSPPVVAVNCDNRKVMGKEKWLRKNQQKVQEDIEFRKKKNGKMEIKFEINKELECK